MALLEGPGLCLREKNFLCATSIRHSWGLQALVTPQG